MVELKLEIMGDVEHDQESIILMFFFQNTVDDKWASSESFSRKVW